MKKDTATDNNEPAETADPKVEGVDFTWGLKIPLRDGVKLSAILYKPKGGQPTPAIFTLTPYLNESYHPRGVYFSHQGYAFVAVDCRGRGNSEGLFEALANEARDGHDIVEWLAAQPWCDGQVAMWGGSYGGSDQWLTLREKPAHLKTIVPTAAAHAGVDFPFRSNIFSSFDIQWLTYVSGAARNAYLMNDTDFWIEKYQEMYVNHLPFCELERIVGNHSTTIKTWLEHPTPDAYWDSMVLTPEQYDQIDLPILTITGHYDDDQPGALEYYQRHNMSKSPAKDQHYLVIGPWDHPGTRTPQAEFSGLKFGQDSLLDMNLLHKQWYDWTMKGGPKPAFLQKRVAYYVMGAEKWKYADSLPSIPAEPVKMYLDSLDGAQDVFHSGTMQPDPPAGIAADAYTYDPLDTRYGELERKPIINPFTNQTLDLNLFGNGLVYHTTQLGQELEITGWVKLCAWIAMDVPDTDFLVVLEEVLPDGQVIKLASDLLRARYWVSKRLDVLIAPGEINLYTYSGFTFFSRRIARGSRLRLVICCPNSIFLEKNYNSGGVVAEESGKDARTAHITLYHNKEYASYLELPVVRTGVGDSPVTSV